MSKKEFVNCEICGKEFKTITAKHLLRHELTLKEYSNKFPYAELVSQKTKDLKNSKLRGKARSEETKKKISESNKKSWQDNPNQGRTGCPLSDESKKDLSEKLMGHEVSEETRKKISETGMGREPWNKDLTKEDHPSLQTMSEKAKKWNEENMTDELKEQISKTLKQRYADGMKIPHANGGKREDLNMYVRSSWEANYARVLKYCNKKIEYEVDKFVLYKDGKIECTYTPDFKIGEKTYIEIKGHLRSIDNWDCNCKSCIRDKNKTKLMEEQYPDIKIIFIGKKEYTELCEQYNKLVENWEFGSYDI